MTRLIVLALMLALMAGCLRDRVSYTSRNIHLPRIERELNFYVAAHPWHEANRFFVYPINFQHGQPIGAMVYWKEERTILRYNELEPKAVHDLFAWRGSEVKLDRDTVDTQKEIGGSDYLETHREWAKDVECCRYRGKEFSILKTNALRFFPERTSRAKMIA